MDRKNDLDGCSLLLLAQMDSCITFIDFLFALCNRIENYKLKPYGKKGRLYLNEGVEELIKTGGFDSLITCQNCCKEFLIKTDTHTIDLFLKDWKGEIEYNWLICNACGGTIEKMK